MKSRSDKRILPYASHKRTVSEKGYVLFEALLSVVILTIGIVAVVQVFQKSIKIVQFRKYYYGPARELADAILAQLEIDAMTNSPAAGVPTFGKRGRFDYEVTTTEWPGSPGLRQVSVTVSWTDRGKRGSVTMTALLLTSTPIDQQSAAK